LLLKQNALSSKLLICRRIATLSRNTHLLFKSSTATVKPGQFILAATKQPTQRACVAKTLITLGEVFV
jgi:hypothetical protein